MKSREEICGNATLRNPASDRFDTAQIPFAGIFAVHGLEHGIASRLNRQMDMAAYVGMGCDYIYRLVAHILRMRSGETHAHFGSEVRYRCEQPGKIRNHVVGIDETIAVYVLPEQGNFLKTASAQVVDFVEDALQLPAALSSAGVGHNAVRTEVIASAHYADEATHTV